MPPPQRGVTAEFRCVIQHDSPANVTREHTEGRPRRAAELRPKTYFFCREDPDPHTSLSFPPVVLLLVTFSSFIPLIVIVFKTQTLWILCLTHLFTFSPSFLWLITQSVVSTFLCSNLKKKWICCCNLTVIPQFDPSYYRLIRLISCWLQGPTS